MEVITKKFETAAEVIREMRISVDCGSLWMEEAPDIEQITVEARLEEYDRFDCRVDGGIFWLDCRMRKSFHSRCRTRIWIRVPSGFHLKNLDAKIGVGETEFKLGQCLADTIRLDVGAGKCRFSGIQNVDGLSVVVGTGEIKMDGICAGTVSAGCGVGSFQMKGSVERDLTVNCALGSCRIALAGNESDYNYKLSCGMGSIKVNGASAHQFISKSHVGLKKQAKGLICLESGLGSIDVAIA